MVPEGSNNVAAWYDANVDLEDTRLDLGRLEHAVTSHVIEELITQTRTLKGVTKCQIADIGCGTGRYAIELASKGHKVSITDISKEEVARAEKKASGAGVTFEASEAGDARNLNEMSKIYKADSYDIVLLLGPLYHILKEDERLELLKDALKITRPGGYVIAAFVTMNAHLRDIAVRDPTRLSREAEFYNQYRADGCYTRGSAASMHHTSPNEIKRLLATLGKNLKTNFEVIKYVACEGFLGFQHATALAELELEEFDRWVRLILETTEEETTLGCADHLLTVLRRTE